MSAPTAELDRLRSLAERAGDELDGASALEILQWAAGEFGDDWCVASSMADTYVVHLASRAKPGIDVIFLDTGYHFAETIGTRDAIGFSYPVTIKNITPELTVEQQDAQYGAKLHDRDPNLCCSMRKVTPLRTALAPYTAWATGMRREEAVTRRDTKVVEWDNVRNLVKINPIAAWTSEDVANYVAEFNVLANPLLEDGYKSVGCAPCTRRTVEGEDARAGRWSGTGKVECGLHG